MQRYIVFHEKLADLKKKIVSAAIYPVLLMSVGAIVTLFLLGYVVPRFALVFADSGRDPEGLSSLLFAWGGFINNHAAGLAIGVVRWASPLWSASFLCRRCVLPSLVPPGACRLSANESG